MTNIHVTFLLTGHQPDAFNTLYPAGIVQPLLLTACKHSTTQPPKIYTLDKSSKISSYAAAIKTAVEMQMFEPEAYAGKCAPCGYPYNVMAL
ncbi:hypothetical protein OVX87_33225 [Klebsiella pneumoniae]|nr:hypothetical protein [Klebsiella pneumoniae]